MKNVDTKIFEYKGMQMQFNSLLFERVFKDYCAKHKVGYGEMAERIAQELYVSSEAVRNWRKGINGPGDLERINDLERILELKEGRLLMPVRYRKVERLSERQIDAVKKVYDSIMEFLDNYGRTDFNAMCRKFYVEGEKDPIKKTKDYLLDLIGKVELTLSKEEFDLSGTEIDLILAEYIYGDLWAGMIDELELSYEEGALPTNSMPESLEDELPEWFDGENIRRIVSTYVFGR